MKLVRIKSIEVKNEDLLYLTFTNGDCGTIDRQTIINSSGFNITRSAFKHTYINNDGILTFPVYLDAEDENGSIVKVPIELDPLTVYKQTNIENFKPFEYSMIRKIRTKRHLTLDQVAQRIGVTKQFLSSIERGKVENVGINTIKRILEIGLNEKFTLKTKSEVERDFNKGKFWGDTNVKDP